MLREVSHAAWMPRNEIYVKVDQCFVMNVFFRLPIISYGGLTVSGGGSMTVRAAALARTDRLEISVRIFGKSNRTNRTDPEDFCWTSAVSCPFLNVVHLALKMRLKTICRQVQAASDGALLFISSVYQPDASLPYVAVRGAWLISCVRIKRCFAPLTQIFAMTTDKEAQESVARSYITCNAAEPHD